MPRCRSILWLPLLALLLTGCQAPTVIETTLDLTAQGPVAIDLTSFGGDVTINTDPALTDIAISITRQAVHGKGREAEAAASLDDIDVQAELVPGDVGQVLQIRATTSHAEPHYQRTHLVIDAPEVEGVSIATRNGTVHVTGAAGTVDIATTDGDVRFMTERPMIRPVTIVADDGDVDYRVRGNSRGVFTCEAIGGEMMHRVREGVLRIQAGTDHNTLHGVLNDGDNAINLRAVDGDVRIAVIPDPTAVGLMIFRP